MTEALTAQARELLERYDVPGAALSIVKDGQPVWRELYGVMSVEDRRPVSEDATFDIGSISKTFNAATMALLVEQGAAAWDSRAVDLLPGFRLSDPTLTHHVLVRDLLGQSVGFGEDNITNYNSHFSRAQIIEQLRYLPLRARFRAECAYQQYGPVAGSVIVERLSGLGWEDFMESRVCQPLGLGETFASYFRMPDRSIACAPHLADEQGRMGAIPHRNFDNLAAAGSVVSSLRDMERWFALFAGGGAVGGRRLLQPETVEEMLTPRVPVLRNGIHPQRWASRFEASFVSYGIGWYAHDFAGRRINEHTGALEGFLVLGCSVPSERLAVVVLTNQHQCQALHPLRYLLLAHGLGVAQQDWDARFRQVTAEARRAPRTIDGEPYFWRPSERVAGTRPSVAPAMLADTWRHPGFGAIPVEADGDGLAIDIVGNPCRAEHWHYDLWRAVPQDRAIRSYHPEIFCRFEPGPSGRFDRLVIPSIGTFRRAPL